MDLVDLILTCLHHLLVFLIAGLIAIEWALIRPGLNGQRVPLLARVDAAYGAAAMAVIGIGALRVYYGLKGWEFYVFNTMFWAKMAAFVTVGLISIVPTMRIARWRRAGHEWAVPHAEIDSVRSFLKVEIAVFALIPLFAAAMARGYGY